jgi:30S ribosomal protein 3
LNFKFNILWLENSLGIAIDQVSSHTNIPLTSYYFWPRNDVWEQIRIELNTRKWINKNEKIYILNSVTKILNSWQEKAKGEAIQSSNLFSLTATV